MFFNIFVSLIRLLIETEAGLCLVGRSPSGTSEVPLTDVASPFGRDEARATCQGTKGGSTILAKLWRHLFLVRLFNNKRLLYLICESVLWWTARLCLKSCPFGRCLVASVVWDGVDSKCGLLKSRSEPNANSVKERIEFEFLSKVRKKVWLPVLYSMCGHYENFEMR